MGHDERKASQQFVGPDKGLLDISFPEERSHWLARDLIARARVRFDQPVLHIAVGLARRREWVAGPEPAAAS